jgi:hypothetical protein
MDRYKHSCYCLSSFFSGNVCDADGIANAATGVDYSSCVGGVTGDVCMPGCAVDYVVETAASGFVLTCDGAGNFDGADATLVCIGHYSPLSAPRCPFLQ